MKTRFVKSAKEAKDFPTLCSLTGAPLREVAVVGRSNVGKSSLLNTLFGVKGMSRTSAEPGKTRLLNFFAVDERLFFVDFPGWGYAKVGKEDRLSFLEMAEGYFKSKRDLALLLFLFDVRREPNEEDLLVWHWFKERGIPLLLILTKIDKFGVTHRAKEVKRVREAFGLGEDQMIPFSSHEGLGKRELWGRIDRAISRS